LAFHRPSAFHGRFLLPPGRKPGRLFGAQNALFGLARQARIERLCSSTRYMAGEAGQMFNSVVNFGLSSPTYGTFTLGVRTR
jgi:hypothetical protein